MYVQGGPIVVTTVPSADVLVPRPQVGQARSFTLSGAISSAKSYPGMTLGSIQIAPTAKSSPSIVGSGFHVDSTPGGRVMIGFVNFGPTVVHLSLAAAVPIN